MPVPQFLSDLLQMLLDLAVPAAFCTLAAAGVSLRHEGGSNFHINGKTGKWVKDNVVADERQTFREMAESDLLSVHEGNFARLQVRPSEFAAWQVVWENKELTFPDPEESYDIGRDVVVFWGSDRDQRIRCAISREALDDHFGGDNRNEVEAFRENRPAIEQIAQRKYLSGRVEPDGTVLIRTAEIPY
jgi:hypothetical protein